MAAFLDPDFLLHNDAARELYHSAAAHEPIFDYHCHLPPEQIAANKTFRNLYEIWLAGDHYKWRAMRANGVAEEYCTGAASDWEKFHAFARTVPYTLRNPLYHWTHLELQRFFGIHELLDESSARRIWDTCNAKLAALPVRAILEQSRVAVICTTDDPTDSLEHHRKIRADGVLKTRVYPAWRPDKALAVDQPAAWNAWLDKLGGPGTLAAFLAALEQRLEFFHANGCRLSDHGLSYCFAEDCTEAEAARIFAAARQVRATGCERSQPVPQAERFRAFLMRWFGEQYAARGWVMQLHLGPLRNNNSRLFGARGADIGCDSIGDWPQVAALGRFLDQLDRHDRLPKTIVYNINPADNYALAAMLGNFQGVDTSVHGSVPGKIQFGSGWWFLDQKEGMTWQLNTLSNLGLLSRFVGMLTDSRCFLSYSRHEYFRRILCNLLGTDVENGELPRDMKLLSRLVRDVCFGNARRYFPLEPGVVEEPKT